MSKDLIEQIKMLIKHIQENPEALEKAKIYDLKSKKLLADTTQEKPKQNEDFTIQKPATSNLKDQNQPKTQYNPKGLYAIKLKHGYLFSINVTKDGKLQSPNHHDVLNWLKDRNVPAEVVDYSSVPKSEINKMKGDNISNLIVRKDPHTFYETDNNSNNVILIDALVEKHPDSPDYKEDNYIPKEVKGDTNFAFTPISEMQSNRFGTPDGNLWVTTTKNSRTGEVKHSISDNKNESRLMAYQGKNLGRTGNPELMPDIIGQKQHKGSLIAGANTYLRTKLPFFIVQNLDLYPFYEKTETGYRVGIMGTFIRGSNKPMYVYSDSEKTPKEALDNAINHFVLEAIKNHYKDGSNFDASIKEPDKKAQKLNRWLTHSIYRSPKVNLKDVINQPQTAQKSLKDGYFETLKKAKNDFIKDYTKIVSGKSGFLTEVIGEDDDTIEIEATDPKTGKRVGYANVDKEHSDDLSYAQVGDVEVLNEYQNKGIGTDLYTHASQYLKKPLKPSSNIQPAALKIYQKYKPYIDNKGNPIKTEKSLKNDYFETLKKGKVIDFQSKMPKKAKNPSLKTPKQTSPSQVDPDELQRVLKETGGLTVYDMSILENRVKDIAEAIELSDPDRDGDVLDNLITELDQLRDRVKLSLGKITEKPKQSGIKLVPTKKSETNYFQQLKKAKIYSFKNKKVLSNLPSTVTPKETQPIFRNKKKGITNRKYLKQVYSPNIMPEKQDVPGGDGVGKSEYYKNLVQLTLQKNLKPKYVLEDLAKAKVFSLASGKLQFDTSNPEHKMDTTDPSHLVAAQILPQSDPNRKRGMMVVGSNVFARQNLPEEVILNHDVFYHFFVTPEQIWKVGATITERNGDKGTFVEASGLDINQTLKDLNSRIKQRASSKEQDWHTFDQNKMSILNNLLYRQPKISLKDIQSLDPYKPE